MRLRIISEILVLSLIVSVPFRERETCNKAGDIYVFIYDVFI